MSKEAKFPVMSTQITGILFLIGIAVGALGIFVTAPNLISDHQTMIDVQYLLYFIGTFLIGWALLSLALNPELDESRKAISFFFAVLLVTVLFGFGVQFLLGAKA